MLGRPEASSSSRMQGSDPLTVIGYIEPGHGLSGKKKWLTSDHDVGEMYEASKGKKDVSLWCYGLSECVPDRGKKRVNPEGMPPRKASRYVDKMAEPFFRSSRKPANAGTTVAVSPGKRINMRGQCVDQLLKSHQLLEKGVITKEQYEQFQSSILNDVKKF